MEQGEKEKTGRPVIGWGSEVKGMRLSPPPEFDQRPPAQDRISSRNSDAGETLVTRR
jgi:hypothetical protein